MGAVTYPDGKVVKYISEHFIPWQVNFSTETHMLRHYNVVWTPTVIFADSDGGEQYRETGYLPPHIFIAYLAMGRAQVAWKIHNYSEAGSFLTRWPATIPNRAWRPKLYTSAVSADIKQPKPTSISSRRQAPSSAFTRRAIGCSGPGRG